ncbi:MAG: 5'-nucleotidase [Candidatus Portiera sp.]|nr:5'-nucleotidase [Portiera sp.]
MPSPKKSLVKTSVARTSVARTSVIESPLIEYPLTIATSSSALFDLSESDSIYRKEGVGAYSKHQKKNENKCLEPGYGFKLISKILSINKKIMDKFNLDKPVIEVILLSRNSADTGLRVFNSIRKHKLEITRAAFCSGLSPVIYGKPFNCQLFLSKNQDDVNEFINNGLGAAKIYASTESGDNNDALHIAFDGDAVIFDDLSEKINEKKGLKAFQKNEEKHAKTPLGPGPFQPFLTALSYIQKNYVNLDEDKTINIKTALFTARSAPAHERVILTLRKWGVHLDNCVFMGGQDKGRFLREFQADIFFDDKVENIQSAANNSTTSGHVPRSPSKKRK